MVKRQCSIEGWNRVLAFLLHVPRPWEIPSQEFTLALTPQGSTGFAGEVGEQKVVQVQAGEQECLT